jgi:hypothetical protein
MAAILGKWLYIAPRQCLIPRDEVPAAGMASNVDHIKWAFSTLKQRNGMHLCFKDVKRESFWCPCLDCSHHFKYHSVFVLSKLRSGIEVKHIFCKRVFVKATISTVYYKGWQDSRGDKKC